MQIVGCRFGGAFGVLLCWVLGCSAFCQERTDLIWEDKKAVGLSIDFPAEIPEKIELILLGASRPVFGRWTFTDQRAQFLAAVPLSSGHSYVIRSHLINLDTIDIPRLNLPAPKVLAIYPSSEKVPENLLKIHVAFDREMSDLPSSKYVSMTDSEGDTLKQFFLQLAPELWSEDHKTLTLWLDPGRIKRGLGPNLTHGSPLRAGKNYRLQISAAWPDAHGVPLGQVYQKMYLVVGADRTILDPSQWQLDIPRPGSLDPLLIRFGESLDHIGITKCLSLVKGNRSLQFATQVLDSELACKLEPFQPWESGSHCILVQSQMEDLAGNTLHRLFDRPIDGDVASPGTEFSDTLLFDVK